MTEQTHFSEEARAQAYQRYPLQLLVHDFEIAANVGSVFRIADALGVERLHLTGCTTRPPHRKLSRTARSTEKVIPYTATLEADEVLHQAKADGYRIVALEITNDSIPIKQFEVASTDRLLLVLGVENGGVAPAILAQCDVAVHIPMVGLNHSMNVANACAIAVYELSQRLTPLDGNE